MISRPFFIILTVVFSCFVISCVTSQKSYEQRLIKELHGTTWVLHFKGYPTRLDTIEFIFGFSNTGEESNLVAYRSTQTREICDLNLVNDTLVFETFSSSPPFLEVDFGDCKGEFILLYRNKTWCSISFSTYCEGRKKKSIIDSSSIEIRKI